MITPDIIIQRARVIVKQNGYEWSDAFERLITFCVTIPEYQPERIRGKVGTLGDPDQQYLLSFVLAYHTDRNRIITLTPPSTVPDPAVNEVLLAFSEQQDLGITIAQAESAHRLSMRAEDLVGDFLERYVASHLEKKDWVWACGSTLDKADFLKVVEPEPHLLQVKNRSNSENSSSSAIRRGTVIQKWYRISAYTGRSRWDKLPDNEEGVLSEQGFYEFIHSYVKAHS